MLCLPITREDSAGVAQLLTEAAGASDNSPEQPHEHWGFTVWGVGKPLL